MASWFDNFARLCLILALFSDVISSSFFSKVFNAVKDNTYCVLNECCIPYYVPLNISELEFTLQQRVYGQPLMMKIIPVLQAHRVQVQKTMFADSPNVSSVHGKALALSFHGWPGNGKNFVSEFIIKALFKKGHDSQYVKFYSARHDFPESNMLDEYKVNLKEDILKTIKKCGISLFVFDEVDKMPVGVLEVIKPFIDHYSQIGGVDTRNAIFIFLSNYGGEDISMRLLELYESGFTRNDIKLSHFEQAIRKASYMEIGGFQKASIISSQLIDHYIPFLPLEASHVRMCAKAEFEDQEFENPTEEMFTEVLSVITYGPNKNSPIFANAGCKRIRKQVAYVIEVTKNINNDSNRNKITKNEL